MEASTNNCLSCYETIIILSVPTALSAFGTSPRGRGKRSVQNSNRSINRNLRMRNCQFLQFSTIYVNCQPALSVVRFSPLFIADCSSFCSQIKRERRESRSLWVLIFYFFTDSTRPVARPARPWISEGMMILVA